MLTRADQTQLLQDLNEFAGISDVYFWRGKLVVVNDYDAERVDAFLDETGWSADVNFTVAGSELDSLVAFG